MADTKLTISPPYVTEFGQTKVTRSDGKLFEESSNQQGMYICDSCLVYVHFDAIVEHTCVEWWNNPTLDLPIKQVPVKDIVKHEDKLVLSEREHGLVALILPDSNGRYVFIQATELDAMDQHELHLVRNVVVVQTGLLTMKMRAFLVDSLVRATMKVAERERF